MTEYPVYELTAERNKNYIATVEADSHAEARQRASDTYGAPIVVTNE